MKKVPYGLQNFEKIQTENFYYVDKTKYIETLEDMPESYILFLRPRKFGKSLWLDTMSKYYDVKYSDKFDTIFKDLYIQKHPTPKKSSYHILEFNFSGLNTDSKEELKFDFNSEVYEKLSSFINRYNLNIKLNNSIKEPSTLLRTFINQYKELNLKTKIYLLIDEYDHFANELLSFKLDEFKNIVSKTGFVRKFYEVIKEGTRSVIDRLFITGVAPITLDSLTSGFNISKNMSTTLELNEMMGFTESEVKDILKEYQINDDILQDMKFSYNGYMFNERASEKVYNSDMVLYFISEYNREKRKPKDVIDMNIASDYKKIQNLFKLGEIVGINTEKDSHEVVNELLNEILLNSKTEIEVLTQAFNMERKLDIKDIKTLLFYLGFLTFEKENFYTYLKIPNYSMKKLYSEYFVESIEDRAKSYINTEKLELAVKRIVIDGNINPFANEIENVLKKLSDRDFQSFSEKHIKMLLFSYLILTPWAYVKSEYPVEGGYIDLAMFKRYEEVPYNAIIELKYIKKKDYTEKVYQEKIKEAVNQIKRYEKTINKEFNGPLKKVVMVFVGRELKYLDEVG
ncbi:hypothetical protein OSSY52_03960 [Tepiditoga spiralis]|uniref:AAA-ATPase-like domain-containing protein n=1 Tax=Tepiditoga spiralis TaxID=2108365 RepID=A0A7G1G2W6_9BACT|nr:AAA family ATPase [Tepiditoga spiralis]BBE30255.1 hypothetical protein OSSY52_03960 [Tepiditoga spiralis]